MSRLEENLVKLIDQLTSERDKRERTLAKQLIAIYEEARRDLYQRFLEKHGDQESFQLQHLEGTLREIEKQLRHYTSLTAEARSTAIDEAFKSGKDIGFRMLTAGPLSASVSINVGQINHGMIEALIGDVPKLAGKVEQAVLFRIRDELARGAVMGESIPKIAKRIFGTGLTQEGMKKPWPNLQVRCEVIARTEIIKASDAGYEDLITKAQKAVGEEIYSAWLTAGDDRVALPDRQLALGTHPSYTSLPGYPGVYKRVGGPRPVISTHPRCRCRRIPVLLSWIESGEVDLDGLRGHVTGAPASNPVQPGRTRITGRNAEIPKEKLTEYALSKDHETGRDKAVAFEQALGYTRDNYQQLIEDIRGNLARHPVISRGKNQYGEKYEVVMDLQGPNGKTAPVVTAWIIENGSKTPRLTSIYVRSRPRGGVKGDGQ